MEKLKIRSRLAKDKAMLWNCQELWIFGHEITEGMQAEIDFCKTFNRKIRRIKYGEIKKLIGGKRSYEK